MSEGDVIVRVVRSDGREFVMGEGDWRIPSDGLTNFANMNYDVYSSELPSYDGSIVSSKRIASVDRTVRAVAAKASDGERLRAEAIEFFNSKYEFKCYVKYMGRTRYCYGEQIGFKCSEGNIYQPIEIMWTLMCSNPFMLSEGLYGKNIADIVPRLGFPWMSYVPVKGDPPQGVNKKSIVGNYLFERRVSIENDGDVPSAMRIVIKAKGIVVNPLIRVGGKFVRIKVEMKRGDVFELDATSRPPTVRFNGKSAMNMLDRNSSVMDMVVQVGKTWIEYDADDGEGNLAIIVYYSKQYLGI